MKASDYIVAFLHEQGVTSIFEMAGGMITHLLDSLHTSKKFNIISVHHEQAASFAADAFGRVTGVPGVAMGTSGPGATNLLTGIGSCYFDSTPAVFITGQVNVHELKGEREIRQLGFQETDIVSMAQPITKATYLVKNASDIPAILESAFEIALSGRPGPVLIDIPMNIQRMEVTASIRKITRKIVDTPAIDESVFAQLLDAISKAERPLILAGRGVSASFSQKEFKEFYELTKIPVVTSLLAVDVIPYHDPSRVGFIGSYGNRWANIALGESDLLIVLGSRLDIRQTGAETTSFKENKTVFHIDCESGEINNRVLGCIDIVSDVKDFLNYFLKNADSKKFKENPSWISKIAELRETYSDLKELEGSKGINPNAFCHQVSKAAKGVGGYVSDVGNNQMWSAQSLELSEGQFYLTSGGMGAMGYALPAGVGASFALNKGTVVVISGDGGLQLNIQELQTITYHKLPVKIIVLNNKCLGMIRQFQDSYFDSRYQSTYFGYSAPDFELVAKAYGLAAKTVSSDEEITSALEWFFNDPKEPALLQVMIDTHTNVYPKLAFGRPITEMEPFAKPMDMEGT